MGKSKKNNKKAISFSRADVKLNRMGNAVFTSQLLIKPSAKIASLSLLHR